MKNTRVCNANVPRTRVIRIDALDARRCAHFSVPNRSNVPRCFPLMSVANSYSLSRLTHRVLELARPTTWCEGCNEVISHGNWERRRSIPKGRSDKNLNRKDHRAFQGAALPRIELMYDLRNQWRWYASRHMGQVRKLACLPRFAELIQTCEAWRTESRLGPLVNIDNS